MNYQPNKGTLERKISKFIIGVLIDVCVIFFYDFLYKHICCGCSFELPQLEAVLMSTHNIRFYRG